MKVLVHGSNMHYSVLGSGKPVVFIHGVPTSSYLWRNVAPKVAEKAQCFTVDLIGMGKSDKPEIAYNIDDHVKYFAGWMDALNLSDVTLVMHGWGSVIGLSYAMKNPTRVRGLAFLEAYVAHGSSANDLPLLVQHLLMLMQDPAKAKELVIKQNYLIEKLLPSITLRKLMPEELNAYREPFQQEKDRQVLWQAVCDLPYHNDAVAEKIYEYSQWLQQSSLPKLMMYGVPGLLTSISTVQWAKEHLPQLEIADLGEGLHYFPETCPEAVAKALLEWKFL